MWNPFPPNIIVGVYANHYQQFQVNIESRGKEF